MTLISGCSLIGLEASDSGQKTPDPGVEASDRGDACKRNRSSCLHEGAYEPMERDYAEQEAKRLNRIALERLRRSTRK